MTNDELRALADALEPMAQLERYGSPGALALESTIAYLRAQADAQPVAWMHIDGRVISAATMDQAYRDGGAMQSSLRDYTIPLYTHPAPAAPQAEPKREPLSGDGIACLWSTAIVMAAQREIPDVQMFARLVERAHGIGGSDAE